jgi:hypothetical protein
MEKRYQAFISSTFTDLKDERQAVLKAILELGHMPAGMELFPAIDDEAWELIKDVIDSSDYYVLIIGGRYGSLDEAGLGFTEKEYQYALATKKPVIPLLHENPDNLPRDKTETDHAAWERLKAFRAKVEKKHTRVTWRNTDDLKAKVIVGLTAAIKRHPTVGWVRADAVASGATLVELLTLKNRVAELEREAVSIRDKPPVGSEHLAQDEDQFECSVAFTGRDKTERYPYPSDIRYRASITPTWNAIFAAVAPCMINEARDQTLRNAFTSYLQQESYKAFAQRKEFKERALVDFKFSSIDIDTCMIQLRALGLIQASDKKRSLKDSNTYWTLTPYGNTLMVQLRAIRKEPLISDVFAGEATVNSVEEEETGA